MDEMQFEGSSACCVLCSSGDVRNTHTHTHTEVHPHCFPSERGTQQRGIVSLCGSQMTVQQQQHTD